MVRQLIKRNFINPYFSFVILAVVVVQFYYFYKEVNLQPQIRSDFFFSEKSKIYKDDARIYKKFIVGESVILSIPSDDITKAPYLDFVERLGNKLKKVKGVESVQSIVSGPDDVKAALKNPMWTRFLDTGTRKNSLIVCFIKPEKVKSIVTQFKKILREKQFRTQKVYISGIPYIIEEIRRMLSHDMKQFMLGAIGISSFVLLAIFLSLLVTLGAIITSLAAASLTLIIQQWYGIPVGILTANLGAIVYVLTVSHIVFLTSNWRQDKHENLSLRLASTVTTTLPASFWAMATTVFGFVSLIFVEAKPLQQLGVGGTIGTISAFVMAYLLYPMFLRYSYVGNFQDKSKKSKFFLPLPKVIGVPIALTIVGGSIVVGWSGIDKLDTDPSLLAYFKKSQSIFQGIQAVDKFGGSNPLNFVISHKNREKLKSSENFEKMMKLQKDLESHPQVGSVLSLPVLMQESQTNWMARLLPWGTILNILSREQYGRIARGFVTEDREQALYMIRMKESGRNVERMKIVRQLMAKPKKYDLQLDLVGGSYYMQSQLAQKIKSSMRQGILALVILFTVIILLLSLSIVTTFFATVSILAATVAFLGAVGFLAIPVDIISSPSINIILGLAVDGMVHIILAARRMSKSGTWRADGYGWKMAIKSQGPGVFISGVVIASGFSVFYLSNFPPSQRFGLEIVFGTLAAMIMTLLVLPHLAILFKKMPK